MASETEKQRPQLLAFVLCERVVLDEDIPIIWRVIDTFNFTLVVPDNVAQDVPKNIGVSLQCEVFTRWGPPAEGEFEAELGLILPDGREPEHRQPQKFTMAGEFSFSHVIWKIQAGLSEAGIYAWVLYLEGEEVGRHPFRINITRREQTQKDAQ